MGDWNITAVTVGRVLEQMAPSLRAEFIKTALDMLPSDERLPTAQAVQDLIEGKQ